jgi:1,4-dihydroxy-2-naphthoyl-CoA hydrolase
MDNDLHVEQLMQKSSMPKNLGVEFADLSPVRVVASMPVDDRHLQPLGFLHGGASVTLAESVAMVGAWLNCPPGKMALGSAINANYLGTKRPGGASWRSAYPITSTQRSRCGKWMFATRATSEYAWPGAP